MFNAIKSNTPYSISLLNHTLNFGWMLNLWSVIYRELNHRMNIPDTLPGIVEEDIPKMAGHAAKEANHLYPVLMNAKELEKFYYRIADWR